ncbi:MAG: helix-turn-helix transcriptional regulator [Parcubacteria group bacterium]|jgi:DNA-binding phage protein
MVDNDVAEKVKVMRAEYLQMLKQIAVDRGISQAAIAKHTGLKPSNVSRMLDGKYSCNLDNLIKVADAIGVKVTISNK